MDRQSHSLICWLLALGASMLLTGCPGRSVREPPAGGPATIDQPTAPPAAPLPSPAPRPLPRENHLSPATRSLVLQAHGMTAHGDLDGASSTLDRALRIEPNNPLLWIERGRLRLTENNPRQAESCARKALALASGDRATQTQSMHLLADALRAQNRNPEAREVEAAPAW